MCVSVCPICCCVMLNSPPPTCWWLLWRRPTLSLTHGRWHLAPLPRTPSACRCRSPQKWVVSCSFTEGNQRRFHQTCLVQNLCPVRSDLCIDATFSPLNPRQVRCWYSLMGNRRQGVRLRRRADRRRGQIRTFMSRWTNSCLMHFSWRSPSTRKMASWLTWRYFIARLFWWDVLSSLVLPHEYKLKKNYIIKYTMKSCRKNQCATRMVWLFRQDRAFRTEAETKKSRVSWDTQICCYLDPSGTNMWAPHTIPPPRLLHIYWCKIIVVVFNFAELAIISWGLDILNWFCSRHVINWHCCVFKIQLLDPK